MAFVIPLVIALAAVIGVASTYYFGKNNEVEVIAEEIIDKELNVPQGTVHFPDLSKIGMAKQVAGEGEQPAK